MASRAYVLIEARVATSRRILVALTTVPGIIAAELLAGPYDLIAVIEEGDTDSVRRRVADSIQSIDGVLRTAICTVFGPSGPQLAGSI